MGHRELIHQMSLGHGWKNMFLRKKASTNQSINQSLFQAKAHRTNNKEKRKYRKTQVFRFKKVFKVFKVLMF